MESEEYMKKSIGEIVGQKDVEVPRGSERVYQGLQVGQVVERKIHRGKRNHKYKAFAQVYVLDNEELTDIDNRIILISNEGSFEDIVIGKYGQFKIIQVLKTCYLAVLESIVGE